MTYTHRNGETEPPTVQGIYWFDGVNVHGIPDWPEKIIVIVRRVHSRKIEWQAQTPNYGLGVLSDLEGQWWGPVTPPWETADQEPDWSQAPEWAMFWIWDKWGKCWLGAYPTQRRNTTRWIVRIGYGVDRYDSVPCPDSIDWRTTLRKRPERDR